MYTVWLDPINRLDPTGAERLGQRRVIENAQVALEPKNIRDRLLKNPRVATTFDEVQNAIPEPNCSLIMGSVILCSLLIRRRIT